MPSRLAQVIEQKEGALLSDWMALQSKAIESQNARISDSEMRTNLHDFVLALKQGLATGRIDDIHGSGWSSLRDVLTNLSRQRATQGFSPAETAMFVFSFKRVLFNELRNEYKNDPAGLAEEILASSELLARLGAQPAVERVDDLLAQATSRTA